MMNLKRISFAAVIVIVLCLSGCGKKEATPDTAGKTPGQVALEIMNFANEGKFEEVKKLMATDFIVKIESKKKKTIKEYMDFKTKNQTITSMEVLEERPGKIHPWVVDVKAKYKDGSTRSRVGLLFKLEDGLWKMTAG